MATRFGHISLQMLDELGVTVSAPIYVNIDDTQTVAAALGDAQTIAGAVDGISGAKITEVRLSIVGPLPGAGKTTPDSGSRTEQTGLFNFSQSGSPYKFGIDVPAIKNGVLVGGKIDLTNSDIINFKNTIVTAGAALTVVSTAIKALIALLDSLISFRKHRKAETRRSSEVAL